MPVSTDAPAPRPQRRWLPAWLLQVVVAVVCLVAGGAVFSYLLATKPEPGGQTVTPEPRLVRVLQAQRGPHRCSTTAFGTSSATRQWTAVAETSGDALVVAPEFEPGKILPKDTLLVQIDPEDYRLAERRYASEARARQEQLNELQETAKNLMEIRRLQQEQFELAQKDLVRIEGLLDDGAVTESAVDAARATHLARLLAYQETSNSLTLIPVLKARAEAERDSALVQVEQAKREIDKCTIRLPFDARCVTRSIDQDQFVNAGQHLGSFIDLKSAEVVAMVEARKGATLFPRGIPGIGLLDLQQLAHNLGPLEEALESLDVEVHWGTPPRRGKVTRIGSTLDPATRTFPVIIEVADPYSDIKPGVRPPLVPDVFCEVTLYGATVDDVVVLPRDCIHEMPRTSLSRELVPVVYLLVDGRREQKDGKTYFADGKLKIQEVDILALEEEVAVLQSGVDRDDLVVVSDLYVPREHWGTREFGPASEAMPLRGVLEKPLEAPRAEPPAGTGAEVDR